MYSFDGKAELLADITPIFSVRLSFRNHSNIDAQETCLIITAKV